jgi:hypothetical protein
MPATTVDFIIIDRTNVSWPGALPYRSAGTTPGRGYATEEQARERMLAVVEHYNAKYGRSPGELSVVRRTIP